MKTITQEAIQGIWKKYACRLDNDGDPDVVLADYYEEIADLGGISVRGRGCLDEDAAKDMLDTLRERGCAVLDDPADDGEEDAIILFLPEHPDSRSLALTSVGAS